MAVGVAGAVDEDGVLASGGEGDRAEVEARGAPGDNVAGRVDVTRTAIRMAIGQLADYQRLIDPTPARTILVPEEPRPDLLALAQSQEINVVWPVDGSFS